MVEDEVLEEAVELSEAVLSDGQSYFEREYNGELETYMIVEDIRNRIEVATLDSGEMVYPEDIPDLEELGGLEAARVLRDNPLEPGDYREAFEEKGVVEAEEGEVRYTRDSFAYFLLFDEAERLVEEEFREDADEEICTEDSLRPGAEVDRAGDEKAYQEDSGNQEEDLEESNETSQEESQDKVEELESIWEDVSSE